jgi:hypothetical protein
LRAELSLIYDRDPRLANRMRSEALKLYSWTENLDVSIPHVVRDPANQIGSALSTGDPPGWRTVLEDGDRGSRVSQGGRSPISLLSADS